MVKASLVTRYDRLWSQGPWFVFTFLRCFFRVEEKAKESNCHITWRGGRGFFFWTRISELQRIKYCHIITSSVYTFHIFPLALEENSYIYGLLQIIFLISIYAIYIRFVNRYIQSKQCTVTWGTRGTVTHLASNYFVKIREINCTWQSYCWIKDSGLDFFECPCFNSKNHHQYLIENITRQQWEQA